MLTRWLPGDILGEKRDARCEDDLHWVIPAVDDRAKLLEQRHDSLLPIIPNFMTNPRVGSAGSQNRP